MGSQDREGYVLYGDARSGNCWKVGLMLHRSGRRYHWEETDVLAGATRSCEFLALNPNGKVPLLRLPNGRHLAESNAILLYLAEGTPLLPKGRWARALVHQWLFWEQYSHEPYIAVARFLRHFDHGQPLDPARMAMLDQRGQHALAQMDITLGELDFFAGEFSVADIALYAYTHTAGDGGFDLAAYPAVCAWMARVKAQPGHFDLSEWSP